MYDSHAGERAYEETAREHASCDAFGVRVLGPLQVVAATRNRPLGGHRPRALVATLIARGGASVSRDELITEIWGEAPPRTAVDTLHSYVSRLRRALTDGPVVIRTLGAGYVAELEPQSVDASRFERLVHAGQAALHAGRAHDAADMLRTALLLWRGHAYGDVVRGPIVDAEAHRLEELQSSALDDRIDADLACGHVTSLLPELDALAREHPLRERLQAQRMLALYRAGRQADALAAFQETRTVLVNELGIEPGPLLRNLQARILAQDPDLTTVVTIVDEGRPAVTVTPGSAAGNLPDPLVQPIGLERETQELVDLTRGHRLVTATGLCGSGKTTLALAAARRVRSELPDGVWLVEPPEGGEAVAVASAILTRLRLPSTTAPLAAVVDALRERIALLVLDDCDRAPGSAQVIDMLLSGCRHLRVLATGQRRLHLSYEHRFRVRPLRLPEPAAGAQAQLQAAASRLMLDRIHRWSPQFSVDEVSRGQLVRIVRALDGLPLALEIAAECCEFTGLEHLVAIAEDVPDSLVGRSSAHGIGRSVRALIEASLSRLSRDATELLGNLSVFDAGFTFDAMQAVHRHEAIGRDGASRHLAILTDSSAIEPQATTTGVARFAIPHLLRHAVRADVPPAQRDRLSFRHAGYFGALAEGAGPKVIGPEQVHWLNRLHEEQANLRQALRWSIDTGEVAVAMRVVSGAWRFWFQFGHRREGHGWVREILEADGADRRAADALRQRFLYGGGRLAMACGDLGTARDMLRESLRLARHDRDPQAVALSLAGLSEVAIRVDEGDAAARVLRQADAAAQQAADPWCTATVRQVEGTALRTLQAHDAARRAFEDAEDGFRDAGDEWSACLARLDAAQAATVRGDIATAVALHRTNLARTIDLTATTFDFIGLPSDMRGLASLAARAGHRDLALDLKAAARSVEGPANVMQSSSGNPRDLLRHALEETRILSLNS